MRQVSSWERVSSHRSVKKERKEKKRKEKERKEKKRKGKKRKEKKRKEYTFWCQFNEKPSIIPGCPVAEYKLVLTAMAAIR